MIDKRLAKNRVDKNILDKNKTYLKKMKGGFIYYGK